VRRTGKGEREGNGKGMEFGKELEMGELNCSVAFGDRRPRGPCNLHF